jgi:hypothetical protein
LKYVDHPISTPEETKTVCSSSKEVRKTPSDTPKPSTSEKKDKKLDKNKIDMNEIVIKLVKKEPWKDIV